MNRTAFYGSDVGELLFNDEELCSQWGLTQKELDEIRMDPEFRVAVGAQIYNLKQTGDTIRFKIREQFNYYLDNVVPEIMTSNFTPAAEKIKLIAILGEGAGILKDKSIKAPLPDVNNQSQQSQPVLNIILTTTPSNASLTENNIKVISGEITKEK